ncbi:CTP synthase 2 [Strongyloides ratti]|uniref:CTP synthase n=1 Tax=Strongyloides ratti TaxID=34506 RepID=A0A090LNA5_STRRB|nr:CTP synthase 2 [Strongyloides ratti]CEF71191.2 CTP synthase 2 [Strongyloides ratti]
MSNNGGIIRAAGLTPDLIICRSENKLTDNLKNKICQFGLIDSKQIIGVYDCKNIIHVPSLLQKHGIIELIEKRLCLDSSNKLAITAGVTNMFQWFKFANIVDTFTETINIVLVGKYVQIEDAYASINKALKHAATHAKRNVKINYIQSQDLEIETEEKIKKSGFGKRRVEGKILACQYARENKVPFLKRHRHRYEVKPTIVSKLSEAGLLFVGIGVDNSSNTYINKKKTLSANNLIKMTTSSHSESLLQTINEICSISSA